jgi:hypothetical protein
MYARRSGHSAKNRSRDDPSELNFAGPGGDVDVGVVVLGTEGRVVVGKSTFRTVGASRSLTQPARVRVAAATTNAAEGSVRVMGI